MLFKHFLLFVFQRKEQNTRKIKQVGGLVFVDVNNRKHFYAEVFILIFQPISVVCKNGFTMNLTMKILNLNVISYFRNNNIKRFLTYFQKMNSNKALKSPDVVH